MNLNAVSCLTEAVISSYTSPLSSSAREIDKNRIRKKVPNRSWEVKAGSHVFLICIGRAEIKHVYGWCTDREVVKT